MDGTAFAAAWARDWNGRDLDAIMAHSRADVVFRSKKAIPITGRGEVVGSAALRADWREALDRQPDLHFTVRDVLEGHRMLVITYENHRGVLAAESLWFDGDGRVSHAAACHRATPA